MSIFDYKIVKISTYPIRLLYNYTDNVNTLLQSPVALKGKVTSMTDITTGTVSTATATGMLGKGAADACISLACQDGVCFAISCVGMGFDVLGIVANFVPGPNVTQVITVSGSLGCKAFVSACRNNKLPWKSIC